MQILEHSDRTTPSTNSAGATTATTNNSSNNTTTRVGDARVGAQANVPGVNDDEAMLDNILAMHEGDLDGALLAIEQLFVWGGRTRTRTRAATSDRLPHLVEDAEDELVQEDAEGWLWMQQVRRSRLQQQRPSSAPAAPTLLHQASSVSTQFGDGAAVSGENNHVGGGDGGGGDNSSGAFSVRRRISLGDWRSGVLDRPRTEGNFGLTFETVNPLPRRTRSQLSNISGSTNGSGDEFDVLDSTHSTMPRSATATTVATVTTADVIVASADGCGGSSGSGEGGGGGGRCHGGGAEGDENDDLFDDCDAAEMLRLDTESHGGSDVYGDGIDDDDDGGGSGAGGDGGGRHIAVAALTHPSLRNVRVEQDGCDGDGVDAASDGDGDDNGGSTNRPTGSVGSRETTVRALSAGDDADSAQLVVASSSDSENESESESEPDELSVDDDDNNTARDRHHHAAGRRVHSVVLCDDDDDDNNNNDAKDHHHHAAGRPVGRRRGPVVLRDDDEAYAAFISFTRCDIVL
jgi:hypothetical protein